jgi:hypothetical protein
MNPREAMETKNEVVTRITVDLEKKDYDALQSLKSATGRSASSLVRSAIRLLDLFHNARLSGDKILIDDGNKEREVVVQF